VLLNDGLKARGAGFGISEMFLQKIRDGILILFWQKPRPVTPHTLSLKLSLPRAFQHLPISSRTAK